MTKLAADYLANELVEKLGTGWTPRTWQNHGWHYAAVMDLGEGGEARVTHHQGEFLAEIRPGLAVGSNYSPGRLRATLQYYGRGITPKAAVTQAHLVMVDQAQELTLAFARADKVMGGFQ